MKLICSYFFLLLIFFTSCVSTKQTNNLFEISIEEAQRRMLENKLTSLELTQYYIDRIKKYDEKINSIIIINSDALEIAKQMDKERKEGKVRGPMHGIPVLIKDNIDTKDKMPNTAGSILFSDNFPKQDAFIVQKLRESGAILLGKTNLSEWANFRSSNSVSGWSSVNGQTKNPYNLLKTPCGSSAGTGAAIASDFATIGIGTETDGSIMCPSSVNGIVGIKPTVGLLSRSGIIPISKTQDTPGPMSKSVKDAATLLGVLAGKDNRDLSTFEDVKQESDYSKYCVLGKMKGKRIGIDTSFLNLKSDLGNHFRNAVEVMKQQGAIIISTNHRALTADTRKSEYDILLYEFKDGLNNYIAENNLREKSLENIIELNKIDSAKIMPLFGQEIFKLAQEKGSLEDIGYKEAIKSSTVRCRIILDSVMLSNNLDAFCGPTLGHAWDIDPVNGDSFNGPSSYSIAAIAGYPSITVPMGQVNNLPVGICFIGGKNQEGKIISLAYDYEQKSKKRIPPKLKK